MQSVRAWFLDLLRAAEESSGSDDAFLGGLDFSFLFAIGFNVPHSHPTLLVSLYKEKESKRNAKASRKSGGFMRIYACSISRTNLRESNCVPA